MGRGFYVTSLSIDVRHDAGQEGLAYGEVACWRSWMSDFRHTHSHPTSPETIQLGLDWPPGAHHTYDQHRFSSSK